MRAAVVTAALLLIPGPVAAQTVRAFALDTVPARLDTLARRVGRDSAFHVQRNGPQVLIVVAPWAKRLALRDTLTTYCRPPGCLWEWDELLPLPDSSAVETADGAASLPWGLDAVRAPDAWAMGARGQGVIVTSLDSGIDPTHPGYTVAGGYHAVMSSLGGAPVDTTDWGDTIGACRGHGTHVGGTLAGKTVGVAPDATLYAAKVFQDVSGQCLSYTSAQANGITRAVAAGSRVINISISGGNSYVMNAAVTSAMQAGAVVCRANGNSGTTPPGGTPLEIQTASVGPGLTRSYFSNYGPSPQTDLAAPGEGVESTMPGGGYGGKSGTSMAAPHVCGVAALVIGERPDLSAAEVVAILQQSAQPLGAPIPNDGTGYGLVRADRAIALARGGVSPVGPLRQEVVGGREWCQALVAVRAYVVEVTPGVVWRQDGDRLCLTLADATPRQIVVTLR